MRIDFFSRDNCDFNPDILWGRGLGGAEYALIFLAEELAQQGHQVTVWNNTQGTQMYGKVSYTNWTTCSPELDTDLFVIYRVSHPWRPAGAKRCVFFSCDQATDMYWQRMLPWLDTFICISEYHRDYIAVHYPDFKKLLKVCELGVNIHDYQNITPEEKVPGRMIFCSIPTRGLKHLLQMWPMIVANIPNASLTVTSDYRLWGRSNDPGNLSFREAAANHPGINFLGAVPRHRLVEEQRKAQVMAYPCDYDENFCIAAMECIAAGAVPVTCDVGAVATTVSDSGIVLPVVANDPILQTRFINELVGLFTDGGRRQELMTKGMERANASYSYAAVAARFLRASGFDRKGRRRYG